MYILHFVFVLLVSATAQSFKRVVQNVTHANKSDALPVTQDIPTSNVSEKTARVHTESFINRTMHQLEDRNEPEHPASSAAIRRKEENACTELSQSPSLKLNNTVNEVCI